MRTIIAALDSGPVAGDVLRTACRLADLLDAGVVVLHVCGHDEPDWDEASAGGLTTRVVTGRAAEAILDALAPDDVVLGVVGAKGLPGRKRSLGTTAMAVVTETTKAVVVVPPQSMSAESGAISKILVPLEDTARAGGAVKEMARALVGPGVEIVAVHVFDRTNAPLFMDHPGRDLGVWTSEFVARNLGEPCDRVAVRTGDAAARITDVGAEEHADLIVLSWAQSVAGGRSAIVQAVLARTEIPVLLLQAPGADPGDRGPTRWPSWASRPDGGTPG